MKDFKHHPFSVQNRIIDVTSFRCLDALAYHKAVHTIVTADFVLQIRNSLRKARHFGRSRYSAWHIYSKALRVKPDG